MGSPFYENLSHSNLEPVRDYDYELTHVVILLTVVIIGDIVGGIISVIRRKRK